MIIQKLEGPPLTQSFHREYAKCVRTFCKSVPPALKVTTEEIDTYFRSCALYLWAHCNQPLDTLKGINRLYTDSKIKISSREFKEQIKFYQSNLSETVAVPDFFLRMLEFDRESGTDNSRRFTAVQYEVLSKCVNYILLPSKLDQRRIVWMYEQLAIICDQAEIGADGSRAKSEPMWGQEAMEESEKEIEETIADVRALFSQLDEDEDEQDD